MTRFVNVAAAQLGPIARNETKKQVVDRLLAHLHQAKKMDVDVVVFPELALTTFFPRWFSEDISDFDCFYETQMPGPDTQPLFDAAAKLQIGFYLGYAELVIENGVKRRFNVSILVDKTGTIVGKYRKVHLPGHGQDEPWRAF